MTKTEIQILYNMAAWADEDKRYDEEHAILSILSEFKDYEEQQSDYNQMETQIEELQFQLENSRRIAGENEVLGGRFYNLLSEEQRRLVDV